MGSRETFGPDLKRLRLCRGVSLADIATATKVDQELWAAMERNDFSQWPSGIYARAYVREYAALIDADPEAIVNEFCRWFSQGDRRAGRLLREQAEIVGHHLVWRDEARALMPLGDDTPRWRRADDSPRGPRRRSLAAWMRSLVTALGRTAVDRRPRRLDDRFEQEGIEQESIAP